MAERSTNPILRKSLSGEAAAPYLGIARTQLGILKNLMSFQNLQQLHRTVELSDGTRIFVASIFGQDTIRIDTPVGVGVAEEEAAAAPAAVNRVTDYVGVMMPNPVPYRGVSIGAVTVSGATITYVVVSDGTVLASEVQNTVGQIVNFVSAADDFTGGQISGANSEWMFSNNGSTGFNTYDHKLTFSIPEDCVYPVPSSTPPTYPTNYTPLSAQWNADWAAGIVTFNARRKAWFLKNSTEFMAALKGRFQPGAAGVTRAELQTGALPASWDYQIKTQIAKNYNSFVLADGSHAGRHTKMPIVMSITSAADVIVSDTSAGLTQAGTMVTKRTTTFAYTDVAGNTWSVPIDGTLTQVVVKYTVGTNTNADTSIQNIFLNWYENLNPPLANDAPFYHQFILDRSAHGIGLLWNGSVMSETGNGNHPDSSWGAPTSSLDYVGYTPTYPPQTYTLVGTAPAIFLQYHNTVLPQYVADTAQSSTVMNNSAMYHVKQVELCLFGPAPGGQAIGIFADPTDADGATQIAYYGEASFLFDWTQGKLTLLGWSPRKDVNGNDAPAIIPMPAGYSYKNQAGTLWFNNGSTNYAKAYNCAIGYVWDSPDQLWPDVAEYLRSKIAQMLAGGGDQVLYTVIKQALAL